MLDGLARLGVDGPRGAGLVRSVGILLALLAVVTLAGSLVAVDGSLFGGRGWHYWMGRRGIGLRVWWCGQALRLDAGVLQSLAHTSTLGVGVVGVKGAMELMSEEEQAGMSRDVVIREVVAV